MPASPRPPFLLLFALALACHRPTLEPPASASEPLAADERPEVETVEDELVAERLAIVERLARIDAEIEALEPAKASWRARERELRAAKPIDESALQEVLDQVDAVNEAIAVLRTEQANHQTRAQELEWEIQRRRDDECGQACESQFKIVR